MLTAFDVISAGSEPELIAKLFNKLAMVEVKTGVTAGATIALDETPQAIIAVLAVVSATGAFATKALLATTTDYTLSGKTLTCVTDQSANKLIVIYK